MEELKKPRPHGETILCLLLLQCPILIIAQHVNFSVPELVITGPVETMANATQNNSRNAREGISATFLPGRR